MFKRRAVQIGDERDGMVPILDGLSPGEHVVTEGAVSRDQPNDEVWPTPAQIDQGQITTAVVTTQDLPDAVTIGGRMTFDDTKISHIFSPVNGRITRILAAPSISVAKGAPLVAILSPDVGTYMPVMRSPSAEADRTQAPARARRA